MGINYTPFARPLIKAVLLIFLMYHLSIDTLDFRNALMSDISNYAVKMLADVFILSLLMTFSVGILRVIDLKFSIRDSLITVVVALIWLGYSRFIYLGNFEITHSEVLFISVFPISAWAVRLFEQARSRPTQST